MWVLGQKRVPKENVAPTGKYFLLQCCPRDTVSWPLKITCRHAWGRKGGGVSVSAWQRKRTSRWKHKRWQSKNEQAEVSKDKSDRPPFALLVYPQAAFSTLLPNQEGSSSFPSQTVVTVTRGISSTAMAEGHPLPVLASHLQVRKRRSSEGMSLEHEFKIVFFKCSGTFCSEKTVQEWTHTSKLIWWAALSPALWAPRRRCENFKMLI